MRDIYDTATFAFLGCCLALAVVGGLVFLGGGIYWAYTFIAGALADPAAWKFVLSGLLMIGAGVACFIAGVVVFDVLNVDRRRRFHDGSAFKSPVPRL